jgi:hypothetical protein
MLGNLPLKCSDEWRAHLYELSVASGLPTTAAVIDQAILAFADSLGVQAVGRTPAQTPAKTRFEWTQRKTPMKN